MKKIIGGKMYNPETAKKISEYWNGQSGCNYIVEAMYRKCFADFCKTDSGCNYIVEAMYRKRTGEYKYGFTEICKGGKAMYRKRTGEYFPVCQISDKRMCLCTASVRASTFCTPSAAPIRSTPNPPGKTAGPATRKSSPCRMTRRRNGQKDTWMRTTTRPCSVEVQEAAERSANHENDR